MASAVAGAAAGAAIVGIVGATTGIFDDSCATGGSAAADAIIGSFKAHETSTIQGASNTGEQGWKVNPNPDITYKYKADGATEATVVGTVGIGPGPTGESYASSNTIPDDAIPQFWNADDLAKVKTITGLSPTDAAKLSASEAFTACLVAIDTHDNDPSAANKTAAETACKGVTYGVGKDESCDITGLLKPVPSA